MWLALVLAVPNTLQVTHTAHGSEGTTSRAGDFKIIWTEGRTYNISTFEDTDLADLSFDVLP